MKVLKIVQLIGITPEIQAVLLPIFPKLTDAKRLTLCLYFMSELPDTRHHFRDITHNLDLVNCGYFKFDSFLPLRSTFNAETKAVKDGAISKEHRLWKNIESRSGKWKNTELGNKYALRLLKSLGIFVELHDEVINEDIDIPNEPLGEYLEKESKYEIAGVTPAEEDDTREEDEFNLLAQLDRIIEQLPEINGDKLPTSNTVSFSLKGKPTNIQHAIRGMMDTVKVSDISLQIDINKNGYLVRVSTTDLS